MEMKKILVLCVILLFIGVAIAPSINSTAVKVSKDNDLVEMTSQVCGIQGFGNTTVKLTKQQYNDLQQYMVDFQTRLNQTTTRGEAVPLFKEAVVELNKYGLLPNGMSIKQAQRLVTIGYQVQNAPNIVKRFSQNSINYDCLFTGVFHEVYDNNIFLQIASYVMYKYGYSPPLVYRIILLLCLLIGILKPLRFMNGLEVFGEVNSFFSIGLGGIKKGQYDISYVAGFTGLKIFVDRYIFNDAFCLGFALEIW